MMQVTLTSWRKGLQTISLMLLVREHTSWGLAQSKKAVEDLIDGKPMTIGFEDAARMEHFRSEAEKLGAVCE